MVINIYLLMICAFAVGLSILFFRFFVSARGRYTFFSFLLSSPVGEIVIGYFFRYRPWAKVVDC